MGILKLQFLYFIVLHVQHSSPEAYLRLAMTSPAAKRTKHNDEDSGLGNDLCVGRCDGHCNKVQDWSVNEHENCIPPLHVLKFGDLPVMDANYRQALYDLCPHY